jgi:ABC-type amino acid transport substrate-binding protein
MRTLFAGLMIGLLAISAVRADDGAGCPVPAYLLATDSALPKVADAIKTKKRLDILVIGSGSSTLIGPDGAGASYPARLEAALREKLAGVTVDVKTDLRPKKLASEAAEGFAALMAKFPDDRRPALVVWQTGTIDAMRAIDPDEFRTALDSGIAALQAAGVDALLVNLQYNPRLETVISVSPYNDTMRVVAQQYDIPIFDRFSIMRHWSDAGDFDLFGPVHGLAIAKRVHDCLGRSLAAMVVEASRINPAELRLQR